MLRERPGSGTIAAVFSSRSATDRQPNLLSQALERARQSGRTILDLTLSNPTRAGLPYAASAIQQALTDPRALRYEPEPFGLPAARQAVAGHLAERGLDVPPSRILLTASTSEAYGFALKLLCDPGDEVLVPAPSYPLLEHLAGYESVQLSRYPLGYDGAWHIDLDDLARRVSERTRAIIVVSPNNPTGSYLKRDELRALERLGLPVISDEVFASYPLSDDPRRAASALEARDVLVLALGGLSKLAALPQMKLAWAALGGPSALVDEALGRLEMIADAYLSVGTPVQLALPSLLASRRGAEHAICERSRDNLAALRRALADSAATVLHVEGGWYAVVRLPATRSEDEWVLALLERHGVLVQPGWFYDFVMEPVVIVSLLTPGPELVDGAARLAASVAVPA